MLSQAKNQIVVPDLGGLTVLEVSVTERLKVRESSRVIVLNIVGCMVVPGVNEHIFTGLNDSTVAKCNLVFAQVLVRQRKVVVTQTERLATQTIQLGKIADNVKSK